MAGHARMTAEDAMARLTREDAIGQLRRRDGDMARLGSEGGALKLDWVEMIPWLLAHPDALADVAREAATLVTRGVRHIIWAGMGGSVLSVRVMRALGFAGGSCAIHPLDSTDPAALNTILRATDGAEETAMIAVALGMTSEEPINHLDWFAGVLHESGLEPAERQTVMALPDSYLDRYARDHGLPSVALQLDGGSGTGGRMSAPGTRVFLTPAALYLANQGSPSRALAGTLRKAWATYDLDGAERDPRGSQWVQLACALAAAAQNGAVRLTMETPSGWDTLRDWTEQLMEESLGKGGMGVVVFAPGALPSDAPASLRLRVTGDASERPASEGGDLVIVEPLITSSDAAERLAGLAALYLGLQLTMALYGYLWNIPFAGQPAVEAYKSRARVLRDESEDILAQALYDRAAVRSNRLALALPEDVLGAVDSTSPARTLAWWLRAWRASRPQGYMDVTINGEAEDGALALLEENLRRLAVGQLAIPYKLRRAPAAYHSTEQSEMDGPEGVASLRAVALRHENVEAGVYSARFLEAQAVATWQAMNAQRRACFLSLYDGDTAAMVDALRGLLDAVTVELGASGASGE